MELPQLLRCLGLSNYIAFDFETTGLSPEDDRIIEIAAIKFTDGNPVDRFVTLINPERKIDPFITDITGISDDMIRDKPIESIIIDEFLEFLTDLPIVAHNISFDKSFLDALCERYDKPKNNNPLFDTLQLSRTFLFFHPVHDLGSISEYFGLSSAGSHRAEKDTENCGIIFKRLIEEAASYPLETIAKLLELIRSYNAPNMQLYVNLANELKQSGDINTGLLESVIEKPVFDNVYVEDGKSDVSNYDINNVFSPKGVIAEILENYEERPSQIDYCAEILKVFSYPKGIGVLEAGTGLGKSLAYLFSAIKHSTLTDHSRPVVISCYTKNLQDQLFQKDLPILSKALGAPIKAAMLKGRTNYICKTRLNWLIAEKKNILTSKDIESLLPVIIWMHYTRTGDLSECAGFWNSRPLKVASLIQSEPGFCTTVICGKNNGCYFGNIRRVAQKTDLLIVNHALLIAEIQSPGILPEYDTVIIDEAHNLVDTAYKQMEKSMSAFSIKAVINNVDPVGKSSARWKGQLQYIVQNVDSLSGIVDDLTKLTSGCKTAVDTLFKDLVLNVNNRFDPSAKYSEKYIIYDLMEEYGVFHQKINILMNDINILIIKLKKISSELQNFRKNSEEFSEIMVRIDSFIESLNTILTLLELLTKEQDSNWVYWQEGIFRNNGEFELIIYGSPIDISKSLVESFFSHIDHCILTSATIRVDESFDYFFSRTGLNSKNIEKVFSGVYSSPFHYEDQVKYFQYSGNNGQDPVLQADLIFNLHKRHGKRILALFTSKYALNSVYQELRKKPGSRKLPIFAQLRGSSRHAIIQGMYRTKNGIILGTNAFWEGIDLPGELLEILILAKLPFGVPSEPVIKAYSNLLQSLDKNPFLEYNVPESVIKFRQGFGRLIRTSQDVGVFFVMDERVVKKRYGTSFSDSIPVRMDPFSSLNEIRI
mgnify:CR=1 FL=1